MLYKPKGCDSCGNTGYKGRTGVHELLSMTPALRSLVYKEAPVSQLKSQAMDDGMRTLIQDGILKVIKGDTDIAQIQMLAGVWSSPSCELKFTKWDFDSEVTRLR